MHEWPERKDKYVRLDNVHKSLPPHYSLMSKEIIIYDYIFISLCNSFAVLLMCIMVGRQNECSDMEKHTSSTIGNFTNSTMWLLPPPPQKRCCQKALNLWHV